MEETHRDGVATLYCGMHWWGGAVNIIGIRVAVKLVLGT